jgi:hypothetical protein
MNSVKQYKEIKGVLALAVCFIPLFMDSTAWLGILISDSDSWDGQNLEFRFRVWDSGTFRRKIKSENMKTVQVEIGIPVPIFPDSGIPLFTYIGT